MRKVSDAERRARLATRHALSERASTVVRAVEKMTCLHATEPASVYLSAAARAEVTRADVDRALYEDRVVVKQLAMRRTLFAFPRDLLPAVWGSASERVFTQGSRSLATEVAANGLADDGHAWVADTCATVLRVLCEIGPSTSAELRELVPELARTIEVAPDKAYGGTFPVGPRLLGLLAAGGQVLRGENQGGWTSSRPRWVLTEEWLGEPVRREDPATGYRLLVESWLRTFGPGTEADLVWWLGATKTAVRRALADLRAVEVRLDEGTGYLLPDDLADLGDPDPTGVEPWAALLPVLDPTTMGWRQRSFYLDDADVSFLFDSNGNAGTTAWFDGRIVGCWVQDPDGVVGVVLRHDVGSDGRQALDAEADRLTGWLAGQRVSTVYASALMKSVR